LPTPAQGALAFEQVNFRYPTRPDTAALDNFDLTVQPGERIALVGPSGAGKTTVFQLLLRFYDPYSGKVRIDGVPISDADPAAVRNRIALVPQDPIIFATSVLENVRYARPEADLDAVKRACCAAYADEFVCRLPSRLSVTTAKCLSATSVLSQL
jgi:ATP-binding cassette subfamily B protein